MNDRTRANVAQSRTVARLACGLLLQTGCGHDRLLLPVLLVVACQAASLAQGPAAPERVTEAPADPLPIALGSGQVQAGRLPPLWLAGLNRTPLTTGRARANNSQVLRIRAVEA